jgi:hypothetical protein
MILCLGEGIDVGSHNRGPKGSQKELVTMSYSHVVSEKPNMWGKIWRASGFLCVSILIVSLPMTKSVVGEALRRGHANQQGHRFGSGVCESRADAGGADKFGDRRYVRAPSSWWVEEEQQLSFERRFSQHIDITHSISSKLIRSCVFLCLGLFLRCFLNFRFQRYV